MESSHPFLNLSGLILWNSGHQNFYVCIFPSKPSPVTAEVTLISATLDLIVWKWFWCQSPIAAGSCKESCLWALNARRSSVLSVWGKNLTFLTMLIHDFLGSALTFRNEWNLYFLPIPSQNIGKYYSKWWHSGKVSACQWSLVRDKSSILGPRRSPQVDITTHSMILA